MTISVGYTLFLMYSMWISKSLKFKTYILFQSLPLLNMHSTNPLTLMLQKTYAFSISFCQALLFYVAITSASSVSAFNSMKISFKSTSPI